MQASSLPALQQTVLGMQLLFNQARCHRYCATILAGRAEAMEKHIAQDCPNADAAAKAEMAHIVQVKAQSSKKGQKRKMEDGSMQQQQQQQQQQAEQQQMEELPPVMPLLEIAQQQQAANGEAPWPCDVLHACVHGLSLASLQSLLALQRSWPVIY